MTRHELHLAAQRAYSATIGRGAITVAVTGTSENARAGALARAIAEAGAGFGKRVLLLTADDDGIGDGTVLDASPDAISNAALEVSHRLHVLAIPRGSELHACVNDNKRLIGAFAALAGSFDAIILDGPAYGRENPVIYTPLTAAAFDAVLLVAEPGVQSRPEFDAICTWLSESGAVISAVILNDAKNPTLAQEFVREARRLKKIWPRFPALVERTIAAWPPLNRYY